MALLLSGYSGIWASIKLILVFIFILILAYYGAKLAGKYQNNILNNKSNIRIIETFRIGNNKLLAIAKIGNDYYALGIGKDEFTLIDKLDAEYFKDINQDNIEPEEHKASFGDVLSRLKKQEKDNK
ncbi:MAG: flagellar biosynthetic protein FliO [Lachnospiraceae bacterium]|nr:flagellar biosynthetic protein FliO [Lachnospiraceae bacterium]